MRRFFPLVWLALLSGCAEEPLELGRPNVVFIGLDTVRADHLGPYGQSEYATPHLDALAAESVLFERCYAPAPWTLPSFTSTFTGLYPYKHGVVGGGRKRLSRRVATLAEILKLNGYRTKGYAAVGFFAPSFGMSRGIDDLKFYLEGSVSARSLQYKDDALAFLRSESSDPWFLFMHYFDAHAPYLPPIPYDQMYYEGDPHDPNNHSLEVLYSQENRARLYQELPNLYGWLDGITDVQYPLKQYGADISYLDEQVGELIDALREIGELDRCLLVLMADHGEHLTEHQAYFTHAFPYEENLHVPFLIRLPGGRWAGRRVDDEVSLVDVLPTLLELLQMGLEGDLDGVSLVDAMSGHDIPPRYLFAEQGDLSHKNMVKAVWDDDYRMLYYSLADTSWNELYDRRVDPGDTSNIAAAFPEIVERFEAVLWSTYNPDSPVSSRTIVETVPIDPKVQEKLKALGYTQ